jgi:putative toxin-antitoxin system antitoxin component (TIGR02293 family)
MNTTAIAAVLGLTNKSATEMDLVNIIRGGIKPKALDNLAEELHVKDSYLFKYLHMSYRTLLRYKKNKKKLPQDISDQLVQIARVYIQAIEVLEEREKAAEWIKRKNRALGNNAPIELMDTSAGINMVLDVLGRIEHGVYS